jgi:acyl-coenzyme A synthetase/AMP-(fatty) acid ligase
VQARILDVASLAVEEGDVPIVSRAGADAVYVMFTSGSSGEPKGVIVPHRAVARLVMNAGVLSLAPDDVMAQAAPLGFDASTLEIWAPLRAGGRMVIIDDEVALNPALFAPALVDANITVMFLTTSLFNRLADEAPRCFGPLRRLMVGGESASVPHLSRAMEACPRLELFNGYGPTENTTFTTFHRIAPEDLNAVSVPIGRPIANTQVLVLDEPLNGLDPMARAETIALYKEWGAEGRFVIVSSHILHEVDRISDQVILLSHGYVVAEGEIQGVRSEVKDQPIQILVRCDRPNLLASRLFEQDHVVEARVHEDSRGLLVRTRDADSLYLLLNRVVMEAGLEVESVAPADDDVNSVYQYLIGSEGPTV